MTDTSPDELIAAAFDASCDPSCQMWRERRGQTRIVPPERRAGSAFAGWCEHEIARFLAHIISRVGETRAREIVGVTGQTMLRWLRHGETATCDHEIWVMKQSRSKWVVVHHVLINAERSNPPGLTCEQIEVVTGWPHQTVSAQLTKLEQDRLVYASSDLRRTSTGGKAKVYRIANGSDAHDDGATLFS